MNTFDNITAPATAVGGAITVIRISGPDALAIGRKVWHGKAELCPQNVRKMLLGHAGDDSALAVYMKGPASYTGDDIVELHCHGGAAAARNVLRHIIDAGCRMAEPGEFTFRAFVNGKLDLVQAEAVADIISAGSDLALKCAEKQLSGALSEKLEAIYRELIDLRAESESHLDFPDEELAWDSTVPQRIDAVGKKLNFLIETADIGSSLREGVRLVLAGRPNAGKSSLLNLLLGYERAIVTAIPGTTRDTVEESAALRGIPVHLTDTAGLRESDDPIEQLGIERSCRSIAVAAVTFWLLDASSADRAGEVAEMLRREAPNRIAVWNKCDRISPDTVLPDLPCPSVRLSAKTGEGLEQLLDLFAEQITRNTRPELPDVAINARHRDLLEKAAEQLPEARAKFEDEEYELAALHLRFAADAVGTITGKTVEPDILDNIFSRFCIGK